MSGTISFKCPSCGGYLEFDPDGQHFECRYCGHQMNEGELQALSKQKEDEADAKEPQSGSLKVYHCQMCGAEIVTGATTAATRCYYCHQPVVLSDRLDDEFRPDGVIPFQLDKAQAEEAFKKFVAKKKFIDRNFFSTAQLEDFSGVYYPYWYGDLDAEASFEGEGTRVRVSTSPKQTVTTTRIFSVEREGKLRFERMIRKGLKAADRTLSDGIHPYRVEEMKPYAAGYLSGFLAERRDIEKAEVQAEMAQEAQSYAPNLMKSGADFNSLTGNTSFRLTKATLRSLLLPAWVLTYRGKGAKEPFYYMMNGQTGEICGKLPVNKGKLWSWAAGIFAAVLALLCAGGALLW